MTQLANAIKKSLRYLHIIFCIHTNLYSKTGYFSPAPAIFCDIVANNIDSVSLS